MLRVTCLYASLLLANLCGCWNSKPQLQAEEKAFGEAVRELAPKGGTGVNVYRYESGAVKEKVHWKDYDVRMIEYYLPDQTLFYVVYLEDGGGVLLELTENGEISQVYQTTNYSKTGVQIHVKNNRLERLISTNGKTIISDHVFSPDAANAVPIPKNLSTSID